MKLKEFLNNLFFSKRKKRLAKEAEMAAEMAYVEEELKKIRAMSAKYIAEYKESYIEPLCSKCGKPTKASALHGGASGLCPDCHNAMVYRNQERNAESHAVSAVARMYGCSHEAARFILK